MNETRVDHKGHTIMIDSDDSGHYATIVDNRIRWTVYVSGYYNTAEKALNYGLSYVNGRVSARE